MKTRIILFLSIFIMNGTVMAQNPPEPADKILAEAYKQAARENKDVFVLFHASWCGWCKKLDASINDPVCRDFFDKNYLFVHLTVLESADKKNLENPGATELFKKYAGDNSGIPFFLIYDKKGNLLADSKIRPEGAGLDKPGQNMGCPAADEEVAAFIKLLKKTSNLPEAMVPVITERFKKNRS